MDNRAERRGRHPAESSGALRFGRRQSDAHEPQLSTSRRILVVDDNQDAREYLSLLLSMSGHVVRTARDGIEALEVARDFRPDIVLLDIHMPRLDGYATCQRLREAFPQSSMRIVAVTAWGGDDANRLTRSTGFDAHLLKPVDPVQLGELVERRSS